MTQPPPPPLPVTAPPQGALRPAPPTPPSLWQELADGSAPWAVRLFVTFAFAIGLTGMVPILAYFISTIQPGWARGMAGYPEDWLVALLAVLAAGAFLSGTTWLWSRGPGGRRGLVGPVVQTFGVAAVAVAVGVYAAESLPGDEELVIFGVVFLATAATIIVWLQAYRRRPPRWRDLHNRQDGLPDVLCPACGYRMVGLTESRCPECGTTYTIDELIAKQGFGPAAAAHQQQHPPVVTPTLRSA